MKKQSIKELNCLIKNNLIVAIDYNNLIKDNDLKFRILLKRKGFCVNTRLVRSFRRGVSLVLCELLKEMKVFLIVEKKKIKGTVELLKILEELKLNHKFFKVISIIDKGSLLNIYKKEEEIMNINKDKYKQDLKKIIFLFLNLKTKILFFLNLASITINIIKMKKNERIN
jgi:hypothetical protein